MGAGAAAGQSPPRPRRLSRLRGRRSRRRRRALGGLTGPRSPERRGGDKREPGRGAGVRAAAAGTGRGRAVGSVSRGRASRAALGSAHARVPAPRGRAVRGPSRAARRPWASGARARPVQLLLLSRVAPQRQTACLSLGSGRPSLSSPELLRFLPLASRFLLLCGGSIQGWNAWFPGLKPSP